MSFQKHQMPPITLSDGKLEIKRQFELQSTEKYRCPKCDWSGFMSEMDADCYLVGDSEAYSNAICPSCGSWNDSDGCLSDDSLKDTEWIKVDDHTI